MAIIDRNWSTLCEFPMRILPYISRKLHRNCKWRLGRATCWPVCLFIFNKYTNATFYSTSVSRDKPTREINWVETGDFSEISAFYAILWRLRVLDILSPEIITKLRHYLALITTMCCRCWNKLRENPMRNRKVINHWTRRTFTDYRSAVLS